MTDADARFVVAMARRRAGHVVGLIGHVHAIQRYVLAQAACRAEPDRFRLLGDVLTSPAKASHGSPSKSPTPRARRADLATRSAAG